MQTQRDDVSSPSPLPVHKIVLFFYYIQYNLLHCVLRWLSVGRLTAEVSVYQSTNPGQKLPSLPSSYLFFCGASWCPRVARCRSVLLNGPQCSVLSLSCDLWSVWTAWPTDAGRRGKPGGISVTSEETDHNSIVQGISWVRACNRHPARIYAARMKIWYISTAGNCLSALHRDL